MLHYNQGLVVRNRPQLFESFHSLIEEENQRPVNVSFLANGQTSGQFLSFNQPMVTQQTDSSKFVAASIPQNSQITRSPLVTQPINIPSAPDIRSHAANCIELGIGRGALGMIPFPSSECAKENGEMVLNGHQAHSITSQFANAPDINRSNPRVNFQSSGRLFGILS